MVPAFSPFLMATMSVQYCCPLSLSRFFLLFVTKTTPSRKIFKVKSPRRQRRRRTSWVLYAKRGPYQCDQIGLISKGYSDNFSYKSSPNFGQLFRPTWKGSLFKWTLLLILFVGNFWKKMDAFDDNIWSHMALPMVQVTDQTVRRSDQAATFMALNLSTIH